MYNENVVVINCCGNVVAAQSYNEYQMSTHVPTHGLNNGVQLLQARSSCIVQKNMSNIVFCHLNVTCKPNLDFVNKVFKSHEYDIISLCETNMWNKSHNINISGYTTYENHRKSKGLCILKHN